MPGGLQLMDTSSSGGTGKEAGVVGWPSVRKGYACPVLSGSGDRVKCSWVRIEVKASKADAVVGVCHTPPSQGAKADEALCKQL